MANSVPLVSRPLIGPSELRPLKLTENSGKIDAVAAAAGNSDWLPVRPVGERNEPRLLVSLIDHRMTLMLNFYS